MAKRRVELSPAARSDFQNIWDYTAQTWSEEQAGSYYDEIANRIEDLAGGHRIGMPVLSYPGMLKSLIRSHILYFRLTPTEVLVVRVLHQNMEPDGRLDLT